MSRGGGSSSASCCRTDQPAAGRVGLRLTYSIGLIAAINFLGLGLQPPTADWGLMINENRLAVTVQPWGVLLPVLAIALLTMEPIS